MNCSRGIAVDSGGFDKKMLILVFQRTPRMLGMVWLARMSPVFVVKARGSVETSLVRLKPDLWTIAKEKHWLPRWRNVPNRPLKNGVEWYRFHRLHKKETHCLGWRGQGWQWRGNTYPRSTECVELLDSVWRFAEDTQIMLVFRNYSLRIFLQCHVDVISNLRKQISKETRPWIDQGPYRSYYSGTLVWCGSVRHSAHFFWRVDVRDQMIRMYQTWDRKAKIHR